MTYPPQEDPLRRLVPVLLTVVALATASVCPVASATATGPVRGEPATPARAAGGAPGRVDVTLVTGDHVTINTVGGRQAITTTVADRGPGTAPVSISTFVLHGDMYVLPSDAAPYAGTSLDWSLFHVSALVRGGVTGGAALPLTVEHTAAGAHRTLPGTAAPRHRGTAAPASTAARTSAAAFGRALSLQLQGDVARAHGVAPNITAPGLFAGVRRLVLNSATAHPKDPSPPVTAQKNPGSDMQTLTLDAITRDGTPATQEFGDTGEIMVSDVDDPAAFGAIIPVWDTQNWSVPAGTYDIRAFVDTWLQKKIVYSTPTGTVGRKRLVRLC